MEAVHWVVWDERRLVIDDRDYRIIWHGAGSEGDAIGGIEKDAAAKRIIRWTDGRRRGTLVVSDRLTLRADHVLAPCLDTST
jgi:hypothetical protein